MLSTIYTIGYEGLTLKAFLQILKSHKIERLIDVRRNPISRKPGFSKLGLSEALSLVDIEYVHLVDLGTPQEVRQQLRDTEDYDLFFEHVESYIATQGHALKQALSLALDRRSVLMCFERNPEECHRIAVATHLVKLSEARLTIEHIWL